MVRTERLEGPYWTDESGKHVVDWSQINSFVPFKHGKIVFGGYFGDEGKGKVVDFLAKEYKEQGYQVFSVRGQGSGNAGHTIVVDGKKYDFHYLTSAGLMADIMLLGPGMLIDPIRVLKEAEKLPKEKRDIIMVAERATIVTDVDRAMDEWCEKSRKDNGQKLIEIKEKTKEQIIAEYILCIEELIKHKILGYGVGPSREGYRKREEAFK